MLSWLDHDDWWLRQAAMHALTPIAADQRYLQALPDQGRQDDPNQPAPR